MINITAIYVLWLRELKKFIRAKERIAGMMIMPLFFLFFMGSGFKDFSIGISKQVDYISYLIPGIVGMTVLFASVGSGFSLIWDREFGFLKEIMVAPVSRISIAIGRTIGSMTTTLFQGLLILGLSFIFGFKILSFFSLFGGILFIILISICFVGLGLIFASIMRDMQAFQLIMNFVVFPIFFLSGALYPIENLPEWIRFLCYIDPLTYGIDGMRGTLIGIHHFSIITDFLILFSASLVMLILGAFLFEKSDAV